MDKKALVLGYGISGKSAEKLLKKLGYCVTIYDDNIIGMNDKSVLNDNFCLAVYSPTFLLCNDVIKQLKIKSEDKKDSRKLTLKNKLLCNKSDTEYIFNNKLLINLKRFSRFYNIKLKKLKTPLLNKMKLINSKEGYYKNESIDASKNCIEIISETEFAIKNTKATIYAITGTNGKTTVTTLITEILKQKYRAVAAGNIGVPLSEYCLHLSEGDIAVLEISNFQLMGMKKFKPKMATILNITPDHIDVHKTFENYVNVKKSIFKEQDEEDISIINADESLTQAENSARKIYYSIYGKTNGAYCQNGKIMYNGEYIMEVADLQLIGKFNLSNALACICFGMESKVPIADIKKVIKNFKGIAHRLERFAKIDNVEFVDDSKATNPDSVIKAIESFDKQKLAIIMGGSIKNTPFNDLCLKLRGIKKAIFIGATALELKMTCDSIGGVDYAIADTMQQAVDLAYYNVKESGTVLLSPACASFDMYKDYAHRGDVFKECVNNLIYNINNQILILH